MLIIYFEQRYDSIKTWPCIYSIKNNEAAQPTYAHIFQALCYIHAKSIKCYIGFYNVYIVFQYIHLFQKQVAGECHFYRKIKVKMY